MRKKREVAPKPEMKKPKFKVGEIVEIEFIGSKRKVQLSELKKNPHHMERWIYTGLDLEKGGAIPYIGIDGSEKFANIFTEKFRKNLEDTNE